MQNRWGATLDAENIQLVRVLASHELTVELQA